MGAWHATYANLLRSRFSALVAYAELLVDGRDAARELAQDATVAVFSRRKAPRDTRSAEIACREWMAAKVATEPGAARPAAAVLIAIDGHDEAEVRRVLGRSAPDALPQPSAEDIAALRAQFVAANATYATPIGGTNTVMAPARARHRSARVTAGVGVAAIVGVVAVSGWAAVTYLPKVTASAGGPTASGSPSPSPSVIANQVLWTPADALGEFAEASFMPECGAEFAPEPASVGGTMPAPEAQMEEDPEVGTMVFLSDGFTSDDDSPSFLLAIPGSYVVTRDDVVVYVTRQSYQGIEDYRGVEGYYPNSTAYSGGDMLVRPSMCDARAEYAELEAAFGAADWESMSAEDQAAFTKATDKWQKKWKEFEPGTYRVYQVTPIMYGEQAALGAILRQEGIDQLNSLEFDLTWTDLARDSRMAPYCVGSWDNGDLQCNPPDELVTELLTRVVEPALVDHTDSGVGISEPLEFEVE